MPFAILVLQPFFLRISRDLESAAMVDGCRPLTTSIDVPPLTAAPAKFSCGTGTPCKQASGVAVPLVAVFIGLQRYIVGGLTLGGIKE